MLKASLRTPGTTASSIVSGRSRPTTASLLELPLHKSILQVAWPVYLGNVVQLAVNLIILKLVGDLGAAEIAGYGLSRTIMSWAGSSFWALAVGTMALVARYTGADRPEDVSRSIYQSYILAFLCTGLVAGLGQFVAPQLLSFFGGGTDLVELATPLLRVHLLAMIFMVIWYLTVSIFRAAGEPKLAMFLHLPVNVLHLVATMAFVGGWGFVPRLGIVGVAAGLLVARFVGAAVGMGLMLSKVSAVPLRPPRLSYLVPDLQMLRKVVTLSLPNSVSDLARNTANLVMLRLVALTPMGIFALSAYTVGLQIEQALTQAGMAFSTAAATLVGQNLGARRSDSAEKSGNLAARYGAYLFVVLGAVGLIFARPIMHVFTADPNVIQLGAAYLRMLGLVSPLYAASVIFTGALRGAGETRSPLIISAVVIWVVQIPLAYMFAMYSPWGTYGVWLAVGIGWVLSGAGMRARFRQGVWKTIVL